MTGSSPGRQRADGGWHLLRGGADLLGDQLRAPFGVGDAEESRLLRVDLHARVVNEFGNMLKFWVENLVEPDFDKYYRMNTSWWQKIAFDTAENGTYKVWVA